MFIILYYQIMLYCVIVCSPNRNRPRRARRVDSPSPTLPDLMMGV